MTKHTPMPCTNIFFKQKNKNISLLLQNNKRVNDYFLQGLSIKGHEYVLKADVSGAHACIIA